MASDILVSAKSATSVTEGLNVTLATPSSGLTPSTFTAMLGINQGSALQIAQPVQDTLTKLSNIAYSNSSANVQANAAIASLTSFQSNLGFGGSPNHAAFGDFLNQAHGHIQTATDLRNSTDFMANLNYSDLGPGITDMGSSAERGMTNTLGNLPSAGALMAGTGSMYSGVNLSNFGTATGLVKSLQNNSLANATKVNQLLVNNGVDLNNIDDPVYQDQINNCLATINDPTTVNVVADQFNVSPPGGLPEWNGDDSSLYDTSSQTINNTSSAPNGGFPITVTQVISPGGTGATYNITGTASSAVNTIYSVSGTQGAFSTSGNYDAVYNDISDLLTSTNVSGLETDYSAILTSLADVKTSLTAKVEGGVVSLATLADPTKLVPSTSIPGLTGGTSALTTHLTDLGASILNDASQAPALFNQIQTPATPLTTAAFPSLSGLITSHQSTIDSMTGTGTGPKGLPSMHDFTQHVAGGPSITSFLQTVGSNPATAISALTASISNAQSLFTTAGVDFTSPVKNTLGSSMNFAQNLHKFGADTSGSGVGDVLHNLANPNTPYGESIKASLAEGRNKQLLQDNGIAPINTTPPPDTPNKTNVNFPVTVSRRIDRTDAPGYGTVDAVAISNTNITYTVTNGNVASPPPGNFPPYQVVISGSYDSIVAHLKGAFGNIVVAAMPSIQAELNSQLSGGSPQATS